MTEEKLGVTAVVPSLNPDGNLLEVVRGLTAAGFDHIVVVNDGSAPTYDAYFTAVRDLPGVTVLTHESNRGKGAAIRTAIAHLLQSCPHTRGAVTVDADNQHRPKDAAACARAMLERGEIVLGARDFSGSGIPPRSRFGNRITAAMLLLFCGVRVSDTQTGLRAFPRESFSFLCDLAGDRYEYETNMLLEMKTRELSFSEIKIETVYLNQNRGSHFHVLRDSFRIYLLILKFVLSSIASGLLDYLLFSLALLLLADRNLDDWWKIAGATVFARVFSSICNFMLNRRVVFQNAGRRLPLLRRYYTLAVLQMSASAFLVWVLSLPIPDADTLITILLKVVIDTVLFLLSFRIQREWVFRKEKEEL